MNKLEKTQVAAVVRDAIKNALEGSTEVWLTAEQVSEQFGMFSKGWLKTEGWRLPRTRAQWTDDDGTVHRTCWTYPRNRLQRMIEEGNIDNL